MNQARLPPTLTAMSGDSHESAEASGSSDSVVNTRFIFWVKPAQCTLKCLDDVSRTSSVILAILGYFVVPPFVEMKSLFSALSSKIISPAHASDEWLKSAGSLFAASGRDSGPLHGHSTKIHPVKSTYSDCADGDNCFRRVVLN